MDSEERGGQYRFSVPEPPTDLGSGFLTEYWQSREALPTIRGFDVALYYLQRGIFTVLALPMSSVITVLTMAVSLFLLAGFLLLLQNVDHFLSEAGSTLYLTAYLKDSAAPEGISVFVRELEGNSRVRSVKYVSKDEAIIAFKKELGGRSTLLDGLEGKNPLPASVDIVLRPEDAGTEPLETVIAKVRRNEVVDEVVYGSEWVEQMQNVVRVFRLFGVTSVLVALIVIVFLISNTIKLVIYARRDEISIMQLVGASDSFVKLPFVIGGLFQGLVGAVMGLTLLKLGFLLVNAQVNSSMLLGTALPELQFLGSMSIFGVIALGVIVGALGSLFALSKFMNV